MNSRPKHIEWLRKTDEVELTADGSEVEIWEFTADNSDESVMREWAKHFRNHYCDDTQLDALCSGTEKSKRDYLIDIKFPDARSAPGPSIRAGDFAEILAADFLEYLLGFWVPRCRYIDKAVRNESTKGSDTIGFYFENGDYSRMSRNDTLAIFESKAQFSTESNSRLQDAIDDSGKDLTRKAESLNALKQRYLDHRKMDEVLTIQRFQNEVDRPYNQVYGALAHVDSTLYRSEIITTAKAGNHPQKAFLKLIVIRGEDMMKLVHALYKKAADEA